VSCLGELNEKRPVEYLLAKQAKSLLEVLNLPDFNPLPFLKGGRRQTVAAVLWPQYRDITPTSSFEVLLDDGDRLKIMENRPEHWKNGNRIVLLVHGLTGCYQSNYTVRICRKLLNQGALVVRANLRGCGPGFGLAVKPYHSGRSEDIRDVIIALKNRHPDSPISLVGFSLGANISLKLAGEDGATPTGNLDSVVAISPPIDLASCARRLCHKKNRFFDQYFVNRLKKEIAAKEKKFPNLEKTKLPEQMTLNDFDDLYTAPQCGYNSAEDYYQKCSSKRVIDKITIPSLILCSHDDPIIDTSQFQAIASRSNLDILLTKFGGHVAFLGLQSRLNGFRWMDDLVTRWLEVRLDQRP